MTERPLIGHGSGDPSMPPPADDGLARMEFAQTADALRATVFGEIDLSNAVQVFAALRTASSATSRLIVNLSALTFADSSALRELLHLHDALAGEAKTLVVVAGEGTATARLLQITGIYRQLVTDVEVDGTV